MGSSQSTEGGKMTVVPYPEFHADRDCEAIKKACKGFGTDEDALIRLLCNRSNEQRLEIKRTYQAMFGKDLLSKLKSELSGKLERVLLALLEEPLDFDVKELRRAMKVGWIIEHSGTLERVLLAPLDYDVKELRRTMQGLGTDELTLIDIICIRTNGEVQELKERYKKVHGRDLEKDVESETSSHLRKFLLSCLAGGRDESKETDSTKAKEAAQELYDAGQARLGTDEGTFNKIFCRSSFAQLKEIANQYNALTGKSLSSAIKAEFSGDLKQCYYAVSKCLDSLAAYYAYALHKAMKGAGTDDNRLIRLIVSRSEIDLGDIKGVFEDTYGKSLESWVKGDTSGDYKKALLELIK